MSDKKPIKPIVIDEVKEVKGKSGIDLKYCFFLPTEIEGFYNFFDEHGRTLATGVSSNKPFPFILDGHAWTIQMGDINDQVASGNWSNSAPTPINPPHTDPNSGDEQEGSFQASSGPGVPAGDEDESVSAEPPPGAIVIKGVLGTSDSDKLKGMYFMPDGNTYNLYNKKGKWIESGIQSGIVFTFQHDSFMSGGGQSQKIVWTITDFVITSTAASGKWTNTDPSIAGEQGGSFQASSGPGADPEAVSAASAS